MFNKKIISTLIIVLFISGCATGAKIENMTTSEASLTMARDFDQTIKNQISVELVTGGKKTNPLWKSSISSEAFREAVVKSLEQNDLYGDKGVYQLGVELQKVKQPAFGFDMTVTTTVRYVLKNVTTNTTVMDEAIVATHTAPMSDAFVGVTRLRLASEGSAKKNIEELVLQLSKLNLGGKIVEAASVDEPENKYIRLEKFAKLKKDGIITEEEFNVEKEKILSK
jgi:hypothetical protein